MRIPSIASSATAFTLFFALQAGSPRPLSAQIPTRDRIPPNLASSPRAAIPNTVVPRAKAAADLGPAPPAAVLSSVKLRFNLTPAQAASLDQLLVAQQNPSSPLYHQWLTPEQYAAHFGLSPADIASVTAWLQSQGLAVTEVARSRTFIAVSGTAAQIDAAFALPLHTVSIDGQTHLANLADPTLPAPIAAVVSGITGLNDFRLKSRARVHRELTPQYTSSFGAAHYIAPGDFYTIYDVNPLIAGSINGSGVAIAVVGQTDISLADVAAFRAAAGLYANPPTVKLYPPDPGLSTGDIDEAQLDVEWSGAIAPAASILYVNSNDAINGSLTEAIDNDLAPIVSISYGDCESGWGASALAVYNQLFRQANVQGQTIVGGAGDDGATDCDYSDAIASGGLAVDYPASSPFVTAVGGSMFAENGGTYWSATNGAYAGSALSYIPETLWNETASYGSLAAGGGGASAFFTKPAFQTGTGVPNDFSRDLPDLVLNAGVIHDGYLFCSQGWCTNGFRNAANYLDVVGGTSVGAPAFAGILALVEQKIKSSLGNANPVLYGLANSSYASTVFHDIASGNNMTPCVAGSPNCPNGGSIGYSAGAGYDLASGWGSVDAYRLASDWLLATPTGLGSNIGQSLSSTALTAPSGTTAAGTSIALAAAVASASSGVATTPTGSVQFLVDNVPSGSAIALTGGKASIVFSTAGVGTGPHILTAAYSGDTTFAGSKGAINFTIVAATLADFSLSPAAASTTVASGGAAPGVTFTVAPVNGFTGSVTFSASSASGSLPATYSFNVNPVVISSSAGGSTTLTMLAYVPNARNANGLLKFGPPLLGLLIFAAPRRRRRAISLAAALLSVAVLSSAGCSSSSAAASTAPNVTNTPAGTYSILVTATATNAAGTVVTHNSTVTFVVQ